LPHRQRFLKLSRARSAGQLLSRLSASASGFGVACEARAPPHRSVQLQATLVAAHQHPVASSTAQVKQSSGIQAVQLSGISARGEQWHPEIARCKA